MERIYRVTLIKMLEDFTAPLNEEEAWALCYQGAKYLSTPHFQEQLTTVTDDFYTNCKYNIDDIRSIEVTEDGEVTIGRKETEKPILAYEHVCCLGVLVYQALDYGLELTENQVTSAEFEHLIALMTGCDDDSDNETETSAHDTKTMTFNDVLEVCSRHVKSPLDANSYYANILTNLVSLYRELQGYIDKVKDTHLFEEIKYQENLETERNKYKQIWGEVLQDIQRGKVLKKVPPNLKKSESFDKAVARIKSQNFKLRKSQDQNWNTVLTDIKRGVTLRKVEPRINIGEKPLQQPVVEDQNWNTVLTDIKRGVTLRKVEPRINIVEMPLQQPVVEDQNWNTVLTDIKRAVTLRKVEPRINIVEKPLPQPVVENQVWKQLVAELQCGVVLKKVQPRHQDDEKPFKICVGDINQQKSKLRHIKEEENERYSQDHQCLMEDILSRPVLNPVSKRHLRPLQPPELSPRELLLTQIRNERPCLRHVQAATEGEIRSTDVAHGCGELLIMPSSNTSEIVTCKKENQTYVPDFDNLDYYKVRSTSLKMQIREENIREENEVGTLQKSSSCSMLQKLLQSYSFEEWEFERDLSFILNKTGDFERGHSFIQNQTGDKFITDHFSGTTSNECRSFSSTRSSEKSFSSYEEHNKEAVMADRLYELDKKIMHLTALSSASSFDANGRTAESQHSNIDAFHQNTSLRQKPIPLREMSSRSPLNWTSIQHMKVINNLRGMGFLFLLYMGNVFRYDFLSLATIFYISLVSSCSTPRLAVSVIILLLLESWLIPG